MKPVYMKFTEVSTEQGLTDYLQTRAEREKNTDAEGIKYVYHYTRVDAVINILKTKRWYMKSPCDMNDGGEKSFLTSVKASNLFIASFLEEESESIAMWTMYAQPWEKGVAIRIPIEMIKKWAASSASVYASNKETKSAGDLIENANKQVHYIAYTNMYDEEMEPLWVCGDQKNAIMGKFKKSPMLAGYVKDMVWKYEKEMRLRVSVNSVERFETVLVDIPQEVLDSFEFITGPRFTENLLKMVRDEVDGEFSESRIHPSTFTGRLSWVYCDDCTFRNSPSTKKKKVKRNRK